MTTSKKPRAGKGVRTRWNAFAIFDGDVPMLTECVDEHDGPKSHWELTLYREETDARLRGKDVRLVELRVLKP